MVKHGLHKKQFRAGDGPTMSRNRAKSNCDSDFAPVSNWRSRNCPPFIPNRG
jgi:hypothetical protein